MAVAALRGLLQRGELPIFYAMRAREELGERDIAMRNCAAVVSRPW